MLHIAISGDMNRKKQNASQAHICYSGPPVLLSLVTLLSVATQHPCLQPRFYCRREPEKTSHSLPATMSSCRDAGKVIDVEFAGRQAKSGVLGHPRIRHPCSSYIGPT